MLNCSYPMTCKNITACWNAAGIFLAKGWVCFSETLWPFKNTSDDNGILLNYLIRQPQGFTINLHFSVFIKWFLFLFFYVSWSLQFSSSHLSLSSFSSFMLSFNPPLLLFCLLQGLIIDVSRCFSAGYLPPAPSDTWWLQTAAAVDPPRDTCSVSGARFGISIVRERGDCSSPHSPCLSDSLPLFSLWPLSSSLSSL